MPKIGIAKCSVPGCDRSWTLEGGRQGFVKAAARSHALAHWLKRHDMERHQGDVANCPVCKKDGYSYYTAAKVSFYQG